MSFKEFADKMVEIYGVRSYQDNEDDIENECYFFECPECMEPILEEDYPYEQVKHCCPVCGYEWEKDFE